MKFLDENGLSYLWGKVKTMLEGKQDSATAVTMEQVTQAIAEAAIQTQDVYSTEEQVVGRWIDGKPLYKKTLIVQTSAGLNHLPLTGIDILADASGLYVYGRYNVPIQTYTGPQYGAEEFLAVFSEDGVLTYRAGSSAASRTAYITACYTKTTDQATIELPAALTVNQPLYTAAPQSAAQAELTVGIENEEV